jgi:hypothetical protein
MKSNTADRSLTTEEQNLLDWCCAALTEEQIAECQEEAAEIAGAQLYEHEAAELLVGLFERIIIRNVRAERHGGVR